jgi:DNA-directed RNA polymerase subunit alpha
VTDIVLNVKALVVKNHSDSMKVITVEKDTPGPITGHDIQTGGEVEVINKDHVLANLTAAKPFMMEMVVQNGRGYVPVAELKSGREQEIGIVPLDACIPSDPRAV